MAKSVGHSNVDAPKAGVAESTPDEHTNTVASVDRAVLGLLSTHVPIVVEGTAHHGGSAAATAARVSREGAGEVANDGLASFSAAIADSAQRYRLVGVLGETRLGPSYVAYDTLLEREVALLVPSVAVQQSWPTVYALAKLHHPGVLRVFDIVNTPDRALVATELVAGTSFEVWLASRPSCESVAHAFEQIADGLAAMHAAGIRHGMLRLSELIVALAPDEAERTAEAPKARVQTAGAPDVPLYARVRVVLSGFGATAVDASATADWHAWATLLDSVLHEVQCAQLWRRMQRRRVRRAARAVLHTAARGVASGAASAGMLAQDVSPHVARTRQRLRELAGIEAGSGRLGGLVVVVLLAVVVGAASAFTAGWLRSTPPLDSGASQGACQLAQQSTLLRRDLAVLLARAVARGPHAIADAGELFFDANALHAVSHVLCKREVDGGVRVLATDENWANGRAPTPTHYACWQARSADLRMVTSLSIINFDYLHQLYDARAMVSVCEAHPSENLQRIWPSGSWWLPVVGAVRLRIAELEQARWRGTLTSLQVITALEALTPLLTHIPWPPVHIIHEYLGATHAARAGLPSALQAVQVAGKHAAAFGDSRLLAEAWIASVITATFLDREDLAAEYADLAAAALANAQWPTRPTLSLTTIRGSLRAEAGAYDLAARDLMFARRLAAWRGSEAYPMVAQYLGYLARVRGDLDAACKWYREAVEYTEHIAPQSEAEIAYRSGLAQSLALRGDLTDAMDHARRAVTIGMQKLPPNSPNLGQLHSAYAAILLEAGEIELATKHIELARTIEANSHGVATDRYADILITAAAIAYESGERKLAADLSLRGCYLFARIQGRTSTAAANCFVQVAQYLVYGGRAELCATELRRAVRVISAAWGPNDSNLGSAYFGLGLALSKTGDKAGAAAALEHARLVFAALPNETITYARTVAILITVAPRSPNTIALARATLQAISVARKNTVYAPDVDELAYLSKQIEQWLARPSRSSSRALDE